MSSKVRVLTAVFLLASASGSFADEARLDTSSIGAFLASTAAMTQGAPVADSRKSLELIRQAVLPSTDKLTPVQAMAVMAIEQTQPPSDVLPDLLPALKPFNGKTYDELMAALEQAAAAGLATTAGAAPTPALMANLTLSNVQSVLQDDGFTAKLLTDKTGSYVASSAAGAAFFVSLDGCGTDGTSCSFIVFSTGGWQPKPTMTPDAINTLNANSLAGWGTVFKSSDDGLYYLDYRAPTAGGVTEAWLQSATDRFSRSLKDFLVLADQ